VSRCFAISTTTFDLILSVSLDAIVFLLEFILDYILGSIRYHPSNLTSAKYALDGGISSTNTIVIPISSPTRSLPSSNSMTVLLNDPSRWPSINASPIASYFAGLWKVSCVMTVTNLRCRFTVAVSVGVMYDWGKQD
jgi:hypothetical protein